MLKRSTLALCLSLLAPAYGADIDEAAKALKQAESAVANQARELDRAQAALPALEAALAAAEQAVAQAEETLKERQDTMEMARKLWARSPTPANDEAKRHADQAFSQAVSERDARKAERDAAQQRLHAAEAAQSQAASQLQAYRNACTRNAEALFQARRAEAEARLWQRYPGIERTGSSGCTRETTIGACFEQARNNAKEQVQQAVVGEYISKDSTLMILLKEGRESQEYQKIVHTLNDLVRLSKGDCVKEAMAEDGRSSTCKLVADAEVIPNPEMLDLIAAVTDACGDPATVANTGPKKPRPVLSPRQPYEPELVQVPGGKFLMGSPAGEEGRDSDETQHEVKVKGFKIAKTEVTQAQWEAVMGSNPSYFKGADLPVENVSWNDAMEYIAKLNAKTGKNYRLPSEAEWEYACRGGETHAKEAQRYCGGNDLESLGWYKSNSSSQPHPVGTKGANKLRLFDMSGNVLEWTASDYDEKYNGGELTSNNNAKNTDGQRGIRGGSWSSEPWNARAALRNWNAPGNRSLNLGLRLAQD